MSKQIYETHVTTELTAKLSSTIRIESTCIPANILLHISVSRNGSVIDKVLTFSTKDLFGPNVALGDFPVSFNKVDLLNVISKSRVSLTSLRDQLFKAIESEIDGTLVIRVPNTGIARRLVHCINEAGNWKALTLGDEVNRGALVYGERESSFSSPNYGSLDSLLRKGTWADRDGKARRLVYVIPLSRVNNAILQDTAVYPTVSFVFPDEEAAKAITKDIYLARSKAIVKLVNPIIGCR